MNIRLSLKHLDPPYSMAEEMELVHNNLPGVLVEICRLYS